MHKRIYGCDPYNSTDAQQVATRIVTSYPGPLGEIAFRCQRSWDFGPNGVAERLRYYSAYGMHQLPLLPMPSLLRKQAE